MNWTSLPWVGSWNMKSGGRRLPELAQERKEAKSWSMLTLRATVSRSPHSSRPAWSSRLTAGRPAGRVTSLYDFHIYPLQRSYRKFVTNIPRKGTARPHVPIPIYMFLSAIYIFPRLVCLFCCRKIGGLIVGIYKSLTDRHMNVEIGNEAALVPVLGIYKYKFLCSAYLFTEPRKSRKRVQLCRGS
jgi:hypothetical protein